MAFMSQFGGMLVSVMIVTIDLNQFYLIYRMTSEGVIS